MTECPRCGGPAHETGSEHKSKERQRIAEAECRGRLLTQKYFNTALAITVLRAAGFNLVAIAHELHHSISTVHRRIKWLEALEKPKDHPHLTRDPGLGSGHTIDAP